MTWLGLISFSVYLLHPLLIEVYHHFAWTRSHHPFWLQVLLAGAFLLVTIAVSSVTYLLVERPMQQVGRRVGHWLDARFGPDRAPSPMRTPEPAMAGGANQA
jgi:peptidoglycan/LPS O-acetylase OafA/YrhL